MITLLAATSLMLAPTPMTVRSRAFPGLDEDGLEIGCLVMTSGHMLFGPDGFGGYSGMHFDADTSTVTLLSDRAHLLDLPLTLNQAGQVTGFGTAQHWELRKERGLRGGKDTEAIMLDGDGYLVSRERVHDIVRVERGEFNYAMSEVVVSLEHLEPVENNGGYEGVTRISGGALLGIPETATSDGSSAVVRWDGSRSEVIARYKVEDDHLVTELVADPETGRLFVLERAYDRTRGPRAKISVVSLAALDAAEPWDIVEGEELGRMTFLDGADNMEAMTFIKNADGTESLMLASDDNFSDLQRTVLMTMRITDSCPAP